MGGWAAIAGSGGRRIGLLLGVAATAGAASASARAEELAVYLRNDTAGRLELHRQWPDLPDRSLEAPAAEPAEIAAGRRVLLYRLDLERARERARGGEALALRTGLRVSGGAEALLRQRLSAAGELTYGVGRELVRPPRRSPDGARRWHRAWRAFDDPAVEGGRRRLVVTFGEVERGALEYGVTEEVVSRPATPRDQLAVLAWNVWLRPETLFADGQSQRAAEIPAKLRGYDAVILSEVFADGRREEIREAVREAYPHATDVVGSDRFLEQDGGVMILSRWPIVREAQRTFSRAAGPDRYAEKGVAYAAIDKDGRRYHLLGTHLQSGQGSPESEAIRREQLEAMRDLLAAQGVPADEPVVFGGDLNVIRALEGGRPTGEYAEMLATLEAALPAERSGLPYTSDGTLNANCSPGREFIDYVLWSTDHLAPRRASLRVRPARSSRPLAWGDGDELRWDLSDHFAVAARLHYPPVEEGAADPPAPRPERRAERGLVEALRAGVPGRRE